MPKIVPATPEDAADILALQKRAFAVEGELCGSRDIPPLAETIESVREHIATALVLKIVEGTQLLGSIRGVTRDGVCTIKGLGIEPDLQGCGLGSALLSAIEKAHPAAARFELFTNAVMEGNVRFYLHHGYHEIERMAGPDSITLVRFGKRMAG